MSTDKVSDFAAFAAKKQQQANTGSSTVELTLEQKVDLLEASIAMTGLSLIELMNNLHRVLEITSGIKAE